MELRDNYVNKVKFFIILAILVIIISLLLFVFVPLFMSAKAAKKPLNSDKLFEYCINERIERNSGSDIVKLLTDREDKCSAMLSKAGYYGIVVPNKNSPIGCYIIWVHENNSDGYIPVGRQLLKTDVENIHFKSDGEVWMYSWYEFVSYNTVKKDETIISALSK